MILSFYVGDIESMPFIEALRQFQFRVGNFVYNFFEVLFFGMQLLRRCIKHIFYLFLVIAMSGY